MKTRGASLLEVLVTLALLSGLSLLTTSLLPGALVLLRRSEHRLEANRLAHRYLEESRACLPSELAARSSLCELDRQFSVELTVLPVVGVPTHKLVQVRVTIRWEELLDELTRAVQRASALTGQLMLFCRQKVLQPVNLSVDQVVAELLKLARRVIGEDLEVRSQLNSQRQVLSDRGELEQIVMNLLVNARDALPEGGLIRIETDDVKLEASETLSAKLAKGDYVRVRVSDNGTGIEKNVLPHIFEPYFTTKAAGQGMGLGLATVYAVVERLGGGSDVASQPNRGTEFTIYLPASGEALVSPAPLKGQPVAGEGELILLVEDEDSVRTLVSIALRKHGYRILEACNGHDALEKFRTTSAIRIVVSDLVMPEMGGRDLARHLRELRPELPILFMSGYPAEQTIELGELDAFLPKPFSLDRLASEVKRLLELPRAAE